MKCNDRNFIKRLKKKKEDALEYIIDEYSPLVHAICRKALSAYGNGAIQECLNDIFLAVWEQASRFEGKPEDFKKWIGMLAKYKSIDLFRQLERQGVREQDDHMIYEYPGQQDVQMQLVRKEERNTMLLALSTLPELDRDIFIQKYYLNLSASEIAESLGLSVAAVDNRLYRGKKKLAKNHKLKERFL
ncbi:MULTISPECIES: sigma-70 family RNA polymerase sigma factor [Bacillus]|jgi:RNA polymerase sigma-70 factor, ECF subfamily|uniref:sigma-70 family RNA polymerase sigma factor n=1 Tax=Bacillus TaxID=1386 RepID=UPI000C76AD52|nr:MULTISPECIES: sigma-70 family RNA polymerase sigma factor [Bacillus]MCR6611186.1 sigma-70 family RNA polymerase sigma factor [Bacillus infantis]MDT0163371.1 sigma-70 family RNA polymerase sigma factor [Bacillus sp. AG4(2022)]PLR74763.1 RNA polymerase subunit sigma-70 [Bacillus sp. UMB0728]